MVKLFRNLTIALFLIGCIFFLGSKLYYNGNKFVGAQKSSKVSVEEFLGKGYQKDETRYLVFYKKGCPVCRRESSRVVEALEGQKVSYLDVTGKLPEYLKPLDIEGKSVPYIVRATKNQNGVSVEWSLSVVDDSSFSTLLNKIASASNKE